MKRWRGAPFPTGEPFWAELDDESLLDVPMCDLGLMIPGSGLEPWLEKLASKLQARGLEFRPHYWLGEEWLCSDGVPGSSIPFYLAHPRLARLELSVDSTLMLA